MKTEPVKEPYFARHAPGGVGYEIIKREDFTRVYETPDVDQAKEACKILLENNGDTTKLPKPSKKWPAKIMIFREKHGDRYFIVKTNKNIENVALKIVLERKEQGWFYEPTERNFAEPMTVEQIEALPTEGLRKAAQQEMRNLLADKRYYREEIDSWGLLQKIVENKSGKLALKFLHSRRDGEYERFEIEEPSNDEPVY